MTRVLLFLCLVQMAGWSQAQPGPDSQKGTVVLRVVIGTDGVPSDPEVIRSFSPEADKNAQESVQRWRFRPAIRKGKPVPIVAVIEVNFAKLPDGATPAPPSVFQGVAPTSEPVDPGGRAIMHWYLRAAAAGDVDAEIEVARRLSSGKHGDLDLVRAYAWATIAANRGSKQAKSLRVRLAKRIGPEQIQAADRMAADWQPGRVLGDEKPAEHRL